MAIFLPMPMTEQIPLCITDLVKAGMAINNKDFSTIQSAHESTGPEFVNYLPHQKRHLPSKDYIAGLKAPQMLERGGPSGIERGVRAKMIHNVGSDTYMTKPYFPSTRRGFNPLGMPLGGWATLTTKAMYQAAGLTKEIEDVSFNLMNNIPTTVHRFASNYTPVYTLHQEVAHLGSPIRRTPRPLTIYQIGIMDFLTGNRDRTSLNLLVSDRADEDGHHDLLAIDHEGAFQYDRPGQETLAQYLSDNSALKRAADASYSGDVNEVIEWWNSVSPKIRSAFENNLKLIRNADMAKHISDQFVSRFELVNTAMANAATASRALHDQKHSSVEIKPFNPPKFESPTLESAMPKDPVEAILAIAKIYDAQRPKGRLALFALFEKLLSNMNEESFLRLYKKALASPEAKLNNIDLTGAINFFILRHKRTDYADFILKFERNVNPGCISPGLRRQFFNL